MPALVPCPVCGRYHNVKEHEMNIRYCDNCFTNEAQKGSNTCAECQKREERTAKEEARIDTRLKQQETKPRDWRDVWGVGRTK